MLVVDHAPDIHTSALLIVAESHFVTDFAGVAVNYALSILDGRRNASNVPVVVVNDAAQGGHRAPMIQDASAFILHSAMFVLNVTPHVAHVAAIVCYRTLEVFHVSSQVVDSAAGVYHDAFRIVYCAKVVVGAPSDVGALAIQIRNVCPDVGHLSSVIHNNL